MRQGANPSQYFIREVGHYIYASDTALHFVAASYRQSMANELIKVGATVRAENRRGAKPLHAAAFGIPGSASWHPVAQVATIASLIEAGADRNVQNMDGATPLRRAVRRRSRDLRQNGSVLQLALRSTGREGSGSPEAKTQQQEILRLFGGR